MFEYLFMPLKIKDVTIKNRVMITGHGTLMGAKGFPSQQLIDYYVERAKGGVGLLVAEFATVNSTYTSVLNAFHEDYISKCRKMTQAVQEHGTKVFQQVGYIGCQRLPGQRFTWAASPIPYQFNDLIGLTPKEIEVEEIQEAVEAWGTSTRNVRDTGFDGVEIHSLYGNYLLGGFLSPWILGDALGRLRLYPQFCRSPRGTIRQRNSHEGGSAQKILVVGGGPGGLKAAEIAAQRGHKVTLFEKRDRLGGQVPIAAKGAGRGELEGITRYLIQQIDKLDVAVQLNTDVTAALVMDADADAFILATGSTPRRLSFTGIPPFDPEDPIPPGMDQENVLTHWQLLEDDMAVGDKVIVAGDGEGHWKGVSIAELLVDQGKEVIFIGPHDHMGFDLTAERRIPLLRRVMKKGLEFTPYTMIKAIDGNTVTVYNIHSRKERTSEGVDHVVLAYYIKANEELYHALKGKLENLHRIGDCVAPA